MNFNQTFSILFWLNKSKANSKGLIPIWVRITVDGKRAECSIQKQILPGLWDPQNNRAKGNTPEARSINNYLVMVEAEITKHYNILLSTKEVVTVEDVKNSYRGIKEVKKTFLQLFSLYSQQLSERNEVDDLSDGRFKRFQILYNKCVEFIKYKFKRSDVALDEVKLNFIVEFEHHLRTVKKIGHNTAMKYVKDLKQVMKYGVMLEYIPSNPFANSIAHIRKSNATSWIRKNSIVSIKRNSQSKDLKKSVTAIYSVAIQDTHIRMLRL